MSSSEDRRSLSTRIADGLRVLGVAKDSDFEKFLEEKQPSEWVRTLARASFYGEDVYRALYPKEAKAPPEIIHETPKGPTGPTGPARLRYSAESITTAESIVREYDNLYPDRLTSYRQLLVRAAKEP